MPARHAAAAACCFMVLLSAWRSSCQAGRCERPCLTSSRFVVQQVNDDGRIAARPASDPITTLRAFLNHLAQGQDQSAYALVAPSSKELGDPIAYRAKLDFKSFRNELADSDNRGKFARYKISEAHWESESQARVFVTLGGWDNDETLIVSENGHWYVADPIHIIR